jgi:hypothetical protein
VLAGVGQGGDHVTLQNFARLLHYDNFWFQGLKQLPRNFRNVRQKKEILSDPQQFVHLYSDDCFHHAADIIRQSGANFLFFSVLPGGRNFGQKAQKGPGKNNVGRKSLWPNFGRILPKVAERVPRIFSKEVPY